MLEKILTRLEIVATCPPSEYSLPFLKGMVNRMSVSFHKYGPVAEGYPRRVSALDSLQQRLDLYRESGNTEFLIDAANFAMIEFMRPSIEGAFFAATDSDASPGRTAVDGTISDASNGEILAES